MDLNDRNVIAAATAITIVAGTITIIAELVWKPIRGLLHRHDPQAATTRDTDALAQQIKDLEEKVTHPSEYVDGLPDAVNQKLRAAYQEARLLQLEGYQAQSDHKHREAIERFTRALALAENDSQRAALHNLRGNSHHSISQYKEAQADYEEALKFAASMTPERNAADARAAALGNLGLAYQERGDLAKAEEHHNQALEIDREIGNRLGEAADLGNLGIVYRRRGDLDKAEEHYKQALEIDREIGNRLSEAQSWLNLGNVHFQRGDPDKAEEHYEKALAIHREIGNRLGEAQDLCGLGNVHFQRGDPDKAEEHFEKALAIHREIGNRLGEAQDLCGLGNVHFQRGDLDKAEEHYEKGLEIAREIGDRLGEADVLGNLGIVHRDRGDTKNARKYLQQAQAIYREIGAGGQGPDIVRRALEEIAELERQQQERGE